MSIQPTAPLGAVLHGEVQTRDERGRLTCRAHFADGLLHGLTERYDEEQRLLQSIHYRDGAIDGRMTVFADGGLVAEIDYVRGLCHGLLLSYGQNAALSSRVPHVAGKAHGTAQYYFPDGALARRAQYVDGLLEGEACDYGQDGALLSRTVYRRGKKHGQSQQYYPNGALKEEAQFADGLPTGAPRKYDEDGAPEGAAKEPPKPKHRLEWLNKWIEG